MSGSDTHADENERLRDHASRLLTENAVLRAERDRERARADRLADALEMVGDMVERNSPSARSKAHFVNSIASIIGGALFDGSNTAPRVPATAAPNAASPEGNDGERGALDRERARADELLRQRDDYRDKWYGTVSASVAAGYHERAERERARADRLEALDRAAYYYRRELREIIQDCGHDKPDIRKIRERAETAIRAADHELAALSAGSGDGNTAAAKPEGWPDKCGRCGAPWERLSFDPADGFCCSSCGSCDSDE